MRIKNFGNVLSGILNDILAFVRGDRKARVVALLVVLGLLSFVSGMFGQFVFMLLIVAAIVVAFFVGVFELKKIGIELVTFTTVLAGFVYGPVVGLAMGAILVTIHLILTKSLGPYILYCIPMMGVVGLLAGSLSAGGVGGEVFVGDIATLGIMLSLLYNLVTGGLGSVIMKDFFEELLWSGSNFALNYVLFLKVAPAILLLMGV